jgi:hypothetical protein
MSILINFSGHFLCKEATEILKKKYETILNYEPIDFDFEKDIETQVSKIISNIPCTLDGSIPLSIIPPGQATLAILLVSYIHGITGFFPMICYLQINEHGLYLPKAEYTINLQSIRASGRKYRTTLFKLN